MQEQLKTKLRSKSDKLKRLSGTVLLTAANLSCLLIHYANCEHQNNKYSDYVMWLRCNNSSKIR